MWILFFGISTIILSFFGPGAVPLSLLFIAIGLWIGRLWTSWGRYLSQKLVINPLIKLSDKNIDDREYGFITKQIIGGDINRSFLQFQSNDLDISSINSFFKESLKIVFPYIAITITLARVLVDLGLNLSFQTGNLGALWIALLLSFFALGIYLPFSKIVEDSKIMIIKQNGAVEFGGGSVRRQLDGLFSVTGLISGYTLLIDKFGYIRGTFQYIGILILIVLVGIPILFPALYVYYKRHEGLVNEFRTQAMKAGIYPAKTTAEVLTIKEFRQLLKEETETNAEDDKPSSFLGKLNKRFMGLIKSDVDFSDDEIEKFKKFGVWLCNNCNTINSVLQDNHCTNCGNLPKRN